MRGYDLELILILCILFVPLIASIKVKSSYNKYIKLQNKNKLNGFDVARKILDNNGLNNIMIIETKGNMTDHYDPKRKVVKLSTEVYHDESIASLSIAAHECGHAIQDKEGNAYMKFRTMFFPVVNICSSASYIIIIIGFLSQILDFIYAGVILMGAGLIFQLVTLPVEFGASKKAKDMIKKYNIATSKEMSGVNNVLNSAAMTYVAGTLATAMQMLRLILMANNRRR